ncbi:hypothetical protein GCM10025771_12150 [Niveibacterium umoris]|uniref:Demethylmenaquinone methyltransferase/2-methoxy-6-polyprenyl-1,4-benzoquinol methylase n=1 Tax=Niveibacterium umoris TaxID=1193620 RepID=A0A840BJT5_9RHOO|nr:class I SAM-dependent methyltransferase [Niveibacterium umoris]MBB4013230.1 demethylmenaquinone methyltransferase/2-methoxy-6-polyprenyl-1,4-benzoquinol methylase [Niveibacterium umoris]
MKAYYSARAPYYDAVYEQPERAADIAFLRDHLPARFSGRRVLEIACGTGYWSQHLAPACTGLVATDGLDAPLAFAKQRPGVDPACCLVADAYALPESLGQFEGAFAGLWLSHVPIARRGEFLCGLHRRLRPGARVLFIDNSEVQCRDYPICDTDADGNTYQMRPLRDGSQHRVLKNFPHESELRAMVQTFGAELVDYRSLDNFWIFEYQLPA